MQSSYLHLSSAALSLAQHLDNNPALDSDAISRNTTNPQSSAWTTSPYQAHSMEHKALRFFSAILTWNDILHCSSQQSVPAAVNTYQKLLADENFSQLFLNAVGCEGWVLVPILETMLFASWKKNQEAQGQLSIRELIAKVDHIELILHKRMERLTPIVLNTKKTEISPKNHDQIRLVHTYIFAHASFVHLHTIPSGAQPSVAILCLRQHGSRSSARTIPENHVGKFSESVDFEQSLLPQICSRRVLEEFRQACS